jgi:hypothetical protein
MSGRVLIKKDSGCATGDPKKPKKPVFRLTEIEPAFVSLVTAGANRQTSFQVVKANACILCGAQEACRCPSWSRKGNQVDKAVPGSDAEDDEKRAAQEARAKQYGVEALEAGANLSYPSGSPTVESLYGDPVNLKYPLGRAANQPDVGRIRNALGRFKQAHGAYSSDASKAIVYARIVEAALAQGVDVSYDPEDVIDRLLPQNVVERLTEVEGGDGESETDKSDSTDGKGSADFASWLDKAGAVVGEKLAEATISIALSKAADPTPPSEGSGKAHVGKAQSAPSVEEVLEKSRQLEKTIEKGKERIAELEKERGALEASAAKLRKERDKYRAQLSKLRRGVGGATSLLTGNVASKAAPDSGEEGDATDSKWASGGDLAAKVAKKK